MKGSDDYLEWGLFFILGVSSALLPVINAEAAAIGAAAMNSGPWCVPVVLIGVGQTLGKVLLFAGVRGGSQWVSRYHRKGVDMAPPRTRFGRQLADYNRRLLTLLDRPVAGVPIMFASALTGFPPLLLVAIATAMSKTSLRMFAITVLIGRVTRFLIIAYPVAMASR